MTPVRFELPVTPAFNDLSVDVEKQSAEESGYRRLLEAAPDAMVVVNQAGDIVLLNSQAEKQFGYSRDALLGQKVTNIIPEGFGERWVADDLRSAEEALTQQIGTGIELIARRKDGSEFPIEIMLSPLKNAGGTLITAAIRDISVRKKAELALVQMEYRYRDLLEAAVTQAGEIVLLNVQAEKEKFGYRRDALLGQKVTNIIPEGFAERMIADDLRSVEDALTRRIRTGIELVALRKDGSGSPIEMMPSPLRGANETLVTAAIRNISVRKSAESVLAQMEDRYRALLEAAPDAMVVVDQGGKIVLLNIQAEKQFGYPRDELLEQPVKNIIPEGFAERLAADNLRSAEDALAQQIGTGIELIARRKDGSQFPIEIMLSPLKSAEGILVTAAIRNISVRKEADKRLVEMESERRIVEEALRISEEQYRMLLDGVHDRAIFMIDPAGRVVSWNAGAELIKGYKADEIIGQNFSCFFPSEDIARGWPNELLRIAAAYGRHEEQGMRVRKDGTQFFADVSFTALRDLTGHLRGFCEFSQDLSASKESEAKYRGLLEAAPDSMVVVNQEGEIVLLNLQAEKQFGYGRDALIGQKVTSIIPKGFAERLIADDLRSVEDALAQQIGTGIELVGLRKDGGEFPIEIMLSPLKSADGTLVTAAIRDISVRKKAEDVLAQMEARYRGLLEAAPDAIVVVNQRGDIVLLNLQAEKRFGYPRDELLGQKVTAIIPEGFAERLIADDLRSAADALAQQIGAGIELIARRKDGSEFPIELMLSPLESPEGILVTAAIRDISLRKSAEAELRELSRSNDDLAQFAYVASHDLQEPLRMVASYTQLLAKRYKGKLDSDADEFIAYAVDGANRMQRLIQDLLVYSRVGARTESLLDTPSEDALEVALANLNSAIGDSGAEVTHDPLPHVLGDKMQLVQLFQNLLGNAIKYQNPGVPRIHVSATRNDEKKWLFSVRDNGLGIDREFFDRIFGVFQRLHKREEFAGTGIGLAICKKIMDRHSGSIWVESQVGEGSTFYFTLSGIERTS